MGDRRIDAAAEADAKRLSMLVGPAFRQLKQALMSEMRDDEAHAITLSAFDAFSRSYSAWELRTGRVARKVRNVCRPPTKRAPQVPLGFTSEDS